MDAVKVAVGARVVIVENPHARDFPEGVLGVVVDVRVGAGFAGVDLFYVAFPNVQRERVTSCGREHDVEPYLVLPFAAGLLKVADAQAMFDRAMDLRLEAHRAGRTDPARAGELGAAADDVLRSAKVLAAATGQKIDAFPFDVEFGMGEGDGVPGENCPHGSSWGSGCADCDAVERDGLALEPAAGFCKAGGCFRRPGHSGPCGARHEVEPLDIVCGTYPRAQAARIVSLFRPGSEGWTDFGLSPLASEVSFLLVRASLERLAAAGYESVGVEVRADGSVLAREADFRLAEFGYTPAVRS